MCLQETAYCSGSGPDPCGASFCHSVLDTESRQIGIHPAARRVLEKVVLLGDRGGIKLDLLFILLMMEEKYD
ncbi:MAG: hypothetical protein ABIL39_02795 [candidate division WOR-3 bacterium]